MKPKLISNMVVPMLICMVFAMLIIPLPAVLLDICFTLNIALALIVLLAAFHHQRPLEFAVFPSIVLFATLFRLVLNVASTRIVLLNGHTGSDAAGQVIQAFAGIVIGNSYTVGLVVFLILIIVNFIVVTKGANRVSEVSARFTLDALPGKQLAIDAELNAGLIKQEEAKLRRAELSEEANFYGAMDGASKFVRGDAVAGILILFINVIGGVLIGTLQHQMSFPVAIERYFLLTVGDGLVAQIPALLISTATALIVTRSSKPQDLGRAMYQQVLQQPRNLMIAGSVVGLLALFPGMPHLVFFGFASILLVTSYFMQQEQESLTTTVVTTSSAPAMLPVSWQDVEVAKGIEVQMGYRLLRAAQDNPSYLEKINACRRLLSKRYGFLISAVRLRDNLKLYPYEYRIIINGCKVAEGEAYPQQELAIFQADPPQLKDMVTEPINGLPAKWVKRHLKDDNVSYIDSPVLLASHCQFVIQQSLDQLFNYEALAGYLEKIEQLQPELYQQIEQSNLTSSTLLRVLKNLLADRVPLLATDQIIEVLLDNPQHFKDANWLSERIRQILAKQILQTIIGDNQELLVVRLDENMEQLLHQTIQSAELPEQKRIFQQKISKLAKDLANLRRTMEQVPVLLVSAENRQKLANALRQYGNNIPVLADIEIPKEVAIHDVLTITD